MWICVLTLTSGLLPVILETPFSQQAWDPPAVGANPLPGRPTERPFLLPHRLLPLCQNWGHFAAGFMTGLRGIYDFFCLTAEVAFRFMGAINPRPISALIEAICIGTKIIKRQFYWYMLKNNYILSI